MAIKATFYKPKKDILTSERYEEITQDDCHPTKNELKASYEVMDTQPYFCGVVIRLQSEYYQFDRYYFVARDGLEVIEV